MVRRKMSFSIERMKPYYLDQVVEIEKKSFLDPWSRAFFLSELRNDLSSFYVAKKPSGKILGYIIFWQVVDEVHILNLAVHPDCRRQGIGRRLLKYCLASFSFQKPCHFYLEVRRGNYPAQNLYKSFLFKIIGIRFNYYQDKEDAVVMKRSRG